MITEIPLNEPHIFAIEVSGKLVADDYQLFRPRLEQLLKKRAPLSLLIILNDFKGWTAKAAWEDLKISFKHDEDFLRIAIVGNNSWHKIMTELGDLFMDTEVEYFDDKDKALSWLKEVTNLAEQDEYQGYRHILIASDFSKYSDAALKKAVEIARPFDAKVTLIHAAEILSADLYPYIGELAVPVLVDNPELEEKHLNRIKKQLEEQIELLGFDDEDIETEVVTGHPVDAIIDFANSNNIDLIVMGSHGRRGLARLLGSATNGVINHAPCDVLTVV